MRLDALQQRRIVTEKIDDGSQPLRQRGAYFRHRLEYADAMPRRGEEISDAVAHQTATHNSDSLRAHAFLDDNKGTVMNLER